MKAASAPAPQAELVAGPLIGRGQVRHERLRPAPNRFCYPTAFLMLPLRSMRLGGSGALPRNRPGLIGFRDRDHGDGSDDCLRWIDELLAGQGWHLRGEVWLHTYPRMFGYAFKPVSFWYCHDEAGSLKVIVVEVNNTFGERHCYLLESPRYGHQLHARKVFHVSPFCQVEGHYRFRFMRAWREGRERTVARIDYDDDQGPLLKTSVAGVLEPLTAASLRAVVWAHPVMTLAVVARIHWQALRLWLKRVPFFHKPQPPRHFLTR